MPPGKSPYQHQKGRLNHLGVIKYGKNESRETSVSPFTGTPRGLGGPGGKSLVELESRNESPLKSHCYQQK